MAQAIFHCILPVEPDLYREILPSCMSNTEEFNFNIPTVSKGNVDDVIHYK